LATPNPSTRPAPARNEACACDSGLKHKHCCGQITLSLPRPAEVAQLEPLYREVQAAFERGQWAAAAEGCIRILSEAPGHVRSLRLLYLIRRQEGRLPAAEALCRRLVTLLPADDWAACELSLMLYERREFEEAEKHARNGVRLNPDNAQAHNLMGMILTDTHRLLPGEFHYRKALELHGPVGKLCANFGLNLKNQGKLEEAEQWYRKAIEMEPDNIESRLGFARLKEVAKDIKGAMALTDAVTPQTSGLHLTRATLLRRSKKYDEALSELDKVEAPVKEGSAGYWYERGELLDKMERYDEAFAAFARANEIVRQSPNRAYDRERSDQLALRLKNFFVRWRVDKLPRGVRGGHEPAGPVFVVGFPRSGTTMIEQMLTSHPQISAGDELPFIWDLTRVAPKILNSDLFYPECLADLWFGDNQVALETFRDFYLKNTRQLGIIRPGVPYFTDKMPLNETNLGFIHLLFPEAPVVHLIRHPLDIVLSCFFNDLTHGNNCSYGLDTAAEHFVLIRDLVDHYLDNMNIKYLPVKYEEVVANPESECRKLLEFVGVEWDPRCLAFHENQRYARTASYAQVTEKLYTRSVYRHRHYLKHLEGIIPVLQPVCERLGYSI